MRRRSTFLSLAFSLLALAGGADLQHSLLETADHPVAALAGPMAQNPSTPAIPGANAKQAMPPAPIAVTADSSSSLLLASTLASSPSLLSLGCLLTV